MTSATDELRELAARMEGLALDTPDMLREAADAIDVLHESERRLMTQRNERLAKAEAENAKLREERDHLLMNSNPTATELRRVRSAWKKDRDENDRLKSENAKLREDLEFANNEWEKESMEYLSTQAENAKLRTQLADVTESMGRVEERCAKLREYVERKRDLQHFARLVNENSALRELVRDMWRFGHMSCSKCVVKNDGYCGIGIDEECPLEHSIYDRMRELGVEVDV